MSRPTRNKDDDDKTLAAAEPQDTTDSLSATTSTTPPAQPDNVPWYLKVDVPKHATLTPHDTPLPDIPPNAPALLTPLVSFVADDLGLDDLTLLDLRALDPPAALGPDLLMLFGSARSERHLHVSADRLVRWLRKHGIHANADGLLGRNELKIKLRRKARRAKLLGTSNMAQLEAAANGGEAQVDDGISTQWVCLHAGTLGRSSEEGRAVDDEGRTSGFGSLRSTGTTVVVQMFTEAKRKQLDLETLWSRTLERGVKARTDAGEELPEWAITAANAARAKRGGNENGGGAEADIDDAFSARPTASSSSFGGRQSRFFSTSARRLADLEQLDPNLDPNLDLDIVASLTQPWLGADDVAKMSTRLALDSAGKAQLQEQLIRYLDGLTSLDTINELGFLPSGSRSLRTAASNFITASATCMRDVPPAETWALRARVHARALLFRHGSYDLAGLVELIREMQEGGLPVDRELCALLLRSLFTPQRDERQLEGLSPEQQATREATLLALKKETALSLLNTMYERGQETIARDVIVAMIAPLAQSNSVVLANNQANEVYAKELEQNRAAAAAVGLPPDLDNGVPHFEAVNDVTIDVGVEQNEKGATGAGAAAKAAYDLQTTLEALLHQADLPCLDDEQMTLLLSSYADAEDWTRFWALWRMPPQHGLPRSPALYTYVYKRMAKTGHKALCIDAVRRCFHEMMHEQVPVPPKGSVYTALKLCIKVADPGAESIAKNLPAVLDEMDSAMIRLSRKEFVQILRMVDNMR